MASNRGIDKARAGLAALGDRDLPINPTWQPRVDRLWEICTDALVSPSGTKPITSAALAEALARGLPGLSHNPLNSITPTLGIARLLDTSAETLTSEFGSVRLIDLCRLGCAVLCAATLASGGTPPKHSLHEGVRGLADALVHAHGGRSIEVRMPPVIAVQVASQAAGPTHRRGTPPNVVEMPPHTFLLLTTGLLSWDDAIGAHGLTHSGAHAHEVAAHLPVLDLR